MGVLYLFFVVCRLYAADLGHLGRVKYRQLSIQAVVPHDSVTTSEKPPNRGGGTGPQNSLTAKVFDDKRSQQRISCELQGVGWRSIVPTELVAFRAFSL